jgi:hypothetical protein
MNPEKDFGSFHISATGRVFVSDLELFKLVQAEQERLQEAARANLVSQLPQIKPTYIPI